MARHQLVKDYQTFKQITIITGVTLQSAFDNTSLLICSVLKVSQQVFCWFKLFFTTGCLDFLSKYPQNSKSIGKNNKEYIYTSIDTFFALINKIYTIWTQTLKDQNLQLVLNYTFEFYRSNTFNVPEMISSF